MTTLPPPKKKDHEETIEESNEVFESLNAHVEAMDIKLSQEMQDIEKMKDNPYN